MDIGFKLLTFSYKQLRNLKSQKINGNLRSEKLKLKKKIKMTLIETSCARNTYKNLGKNLT